MKRLIALTVLSALTLVACGVATDGGAQRIDPQQLGGLGDTLPAPSTSTTSPVTTLPLVPTTTDATPTTIVQTELVDLYFISGRKIFPVRAVLPADADMQIVMAILQAGPGPDSPGLRSAIPTEDALTPVITTDGSGVATVNVPTDFFSSIQPATDQGLAIAQIVLTVLFRRGLAVGQVKFVQDGVDISVPKADGEPTQPGEPVTFKDYAALLSSSTTPPTGTSTTTTTVVAPPGTAAP